MGRNFHDDLRKELEDPEFSAGYANSRVESAKELLRCGRIKSLSIGTMEMSKTVHMDWGS